MLHTDTVHNKDSSDKHMEPRPEAVMRRITTLSCSAGWLVAQQLESGRGTLLVYYRRIAFFLRGDRATFFYFDRLGKYTPEWYH